MCAELPLIGVSVILLFTMYGVSLNVTTDLSHFERIVPCGIPGVAMTSLQQETRKRKGERDLWEQTVQAVIRRHTKAFGLTIATSREGILHPAPSTASLTSRTVLLSCCVS